MTVTILKGDCREVLRTLPDESVHCVVTSPPYFGLRDYGMAGQIGLEPNWQDYVASMVGVFRQVRRVLRADGTCWLNLGDSYGPGKQLLGVPWQVAFALQADGWLLRQDIIWSKPNPMPESVRDRCTKAHEYLFLLSKAERYFYDSDAIAEVSQYQVAADRRLSGDYSVGSGRNDAGGHRSGGFVTGERRNRRSVWEVTPQPFKGSHFATFPPDLIEPCLMAGCPVGGTALDPFGGAGTTGLVADRLQRSAILIELNPEYAAMAERRIHGDGPLFASVEVAQ